MVCTGHPRWANRCNMRCGIQWKDEGLEGGEEHRPGKTGAAIGWRSATNHKFRCAVPPSRRVDRGWVLLASTGTPALAGLARLPLAPGERLVLLVLLVLLRLLGLLLQAPHCVVAPCAHPARRGQFWFWSWLCVLRAAWAPCLNPESRASLSAVCQSQKAKRASQGQGQGQGRPQATSHKPQGPRGVVPLAPIPYYVKL
jgi:hypothetical protein